MIHELLIEGADQPGCTLESVQSMQSGSAWRDGAFEMVVAFERRTFSVDEAIRLRDWLNDIIDDAGNKPFHPMLRGISPYADGVDPDQLRKISDRLYRLDELEVNQ